MYEFLLFNVMSNVATITNFAVLWISSGLLPMFIKNSAFQWFIFKYPTSEGGVVGFISFLIAYVCAQIVNFIVQRKIVFGSTNKIGKALPWYILTVVVAGIISVWLPPHVIGLIKPVTGNVAPTIANFVNIIIQVVINYPMMKFVIMKKD
ncbi:GtrA family protein [Candidatus Enterococcus palustris]|nr:GtrA family protein [Enterococcus sp. 7F3_DIV0205]